MFSKAVRNINAFTYQLRWGNRDAKSGKMKDASSVSLAEVERIMFGAKSKNFVSQEVQVQPYYECFSLQVRDGRTVDIKVTEFDQLSVWFRGLQSVIYKDSQWKQCWSSGKMLWRIATYKLIGDAMEEGVSVYAKLAGGVAVAAAENEMMKGWY